AKAIFSFVPTPSTLETSTGCLYFFVSSAKSPPNPPTFPSTSRRCVDASSAGNPAFTLLPKSISTPARAYAFIFIFEGASKGQPVSPAKEKADVRSACLPIHIHLHYWQLITDGPCLPQFLGLVCFFA